MCVSRGWGAVCCAWLGSHTPPIPKGLHPPAPCANANDRHLQACAGAQGGVSARSAARQSGQWPAGAWGFLGAARWATSNACIARPAPRSGRCLAVPKAAPHRSRPAGVARSVQLQWCSLLPASGLAREAARSGSALPSHKCAENSHKTASLLL